MNLFNRFGILFCLFWCVYTCFLGYTMDPSYFYDLSQLTPDSQLPMTPMPSQSPPPSPTMPLDLSQSQYSQPAAPPSQESEPPPATQIDFTPVVLTKDSVRSVLLVTMAF